MRLIKKIVCVGMVASLPLLAQAAEQVCSSSQKRSAPDSRFRVVASSNGAEVLDLQTNLIWQRCVLGKTWNAATSSCVGDAKYLSWLDAMKQVKQFGGGYRVPNIKELYSLVDPACFSADYSNSTFFPDGVSGWSSTTSRQEAWVVRNGAVYGPSPYQYGYFSLSNFVRLVRSNPATK